MRSFLQPRGSSPSSIARGRSGGLGTHSYHSSPQMPQAPRTSTMFICMISAALMIMILEAAIFSTTAGFSRASHDMHGHQLRPTTERHQRKRGLRDHTSTSLEDPSHPEQFNNPPDLIKSLPKWLAYMHIGKAGGTSFEVVAQRVARDSGYRYRGFRHFDWNEIDRIGEVGIDVDVLTLLREPVSRAISHFYFSQANAEDAAKRRASQHGMVVEESQLLSSSLEDFLFRSTEQQLLDLRDIWQDGQAGVSWLTGTHIASWAGCPPDQVALRDLRSIQNTTDMMLLAADRLDQTKWFGLLEDLDRSLELLQYEFQLPTLPKMRTDNVNWNKPRDPPSERVVEALRSLMPQDLWLYEYAKILFEARWQAYQTGSHHAVRPERPPLPESLPCTSSRTKLRCQSGPLVGLL